MTAKEARSIVESKIAADNSSDISNIKSLIETAVANKKLELDYYGPMSELTKCYFMDEGYKIKYHQTGINEYAYLISW